MRTEKIATVLEQHKASGTADAVLDEFDVSNVTIAFLTGRADVLKGDGGL